jgi:predicted nicotinamide N-methyase
VGVVPMGRSLASIKLQEIDEGTFGSAGTGATTWEASIAMSLYFHSHPDQLAGDVVELGCGVGLGGILNQLMGRHASGSMTLTDGNDQVLQKCKTNIDNNYVTVPALRSLPRIQVSKLDWNAFLLGEETTAATRRRYDTVIACDCAYIHKDAEPFCRTLHGLLAAETPTATIHLFGPYNRSALYEVIRYLGDELDMHVVMEWIEMTRYRLKAGRRQSQDDGVFCSKSRPKFLHVRASLKPERDDVQSSNFSDID